MANECESKVDTRCKQIHHLQYATKVVITQEKQEPVNYVLRMHQGTNATETTMGRDVAASSNTPDVPRGPKVEERKNPDVAINGKEQKVRAKNRDAEKPSRLQIQLREELCVDDAEVGKYKTPIPSGYFDVRNSQAYGISDLVEWQAEMNLPTWYYDSEEEEHIPHMKSKWSKWLRE